MNIFLSQADREVIARKLYCNECGSRRRYLLHWNEHEEFMSLGIGHFIWYPRGVKKVFEEIFPLFLDFLRQQDDAPEIIDELNTPFAPFAGVEEFNLQKDSRKAENIREFLEQTIDYQSQFAFMRMQKVLELLLKNLEPEDGQKVKENFSLLAASGTSGAYALVDYLNFKGDGLNVKERYNSRGWGLLQVLQKMNDYDLIDGPNQRFAAAAEFLLRERVRNSDPRRGEARWLDGWLNRINSYRVSLS